MELRLLARKTYFGRESRRYKTRRRKHDFINPFKPHKHPQKKLKGKFIDFFPHRLAYCIPPNIIAFGINLIGSEDGGIAGNSSCGVRHFPADQIPAHAVLTPFSSLEAEHISDGRDFTPRIRIARFHIEFGCNPRMHRPEIGPLRRWHFFIRLKIPGRSVFVLDFCLFRFRDVREIVRSVVAVGGSRKDFRNECSQQLPQSAGESIKSKKKHERLLRIPFPLFQLRM